MIFSHISLNYRGEAKNASPVFLTKVKIPYRKTIMKTKLFLSLIACTSFSSLTAAEQNIPHTKISHKPVRGNFNVIRHGDFSSPDFKMIIQPVPSRFQGTYEVFEGFGEKYPVTEDSTIAFQFSSENIAFKVERSGAAISLDSLQEALRREKISTQGNEIERKELDALRKSEIAAGYDPLFVEKRVADCARKAIALYFFGDEKLTNMAPYDDLLESTKDDSSAGIIFTKKQYD